MLLWMHLAQALTEHRVTRPAVPLFIDFVGEFVDQIGAQISNQRRHMVGNQADPTLTFAQGFGLPVTLSDIGEGVNEATGGQWMSAHLQHATVKQTQLQLLNALATRITTGRRQQGQIAVGHNFGERSVRIDRRQAAEIKKAVIPQLQLPFGIDHRHALREVVHDPLQQPRLLRQGLFAAQGFAEFDLGDVGVENHQPALTGRPLADLHPAPVIKEIEQVVITTAALLFHHQAGALAQAFDLGQPRTATNPRAAASPERFETTVEQDNALLAVEQHKSVGDTFNCIDQMLVSSFSAQACITEQLVAGFQLSHGLIERISALTHLLGQHHRMLEGSVSIIATRMHRLNPLNQRGIDAPELVVLQFQGDTARLQLGSISHGQGGRWQLR